MKTIDAMAKIKKKLKDPEYRRKFEREQRLLEISEKLVEMRERANLTQREVAKFMHTKREAIARLESGKYTGFTLRTLMNYANACDMFLDIEFISTETCKKHKVRKKQRVKA